MDNYEVPVKKFGALSSSEDPQKIAASVTGSIVMFSSLIIFVAGNLGFNVTAEMVTDYAGLLGMAIGAIWTLFGITRKAVIALVEWYNTKKETI